MTWSGDNSYSSSFFIFFLIFLSSLSIALSSLEEPTLVGVRECTELPDNVRFPLYWTSKYSLDGKAHHGPKDLFTIIGNATAAANSTGNNRLLLLNKKQNHLAFGQAASDGTIRASITEVSRGARVIVLTFIYADSHQCSTMVKDLSEIIDEVNAEYYVAKRASSVVSKKNKNNYNLPSIKGVAFNNIWPLQCDEQEDKCGRDTTADVFEETDWQGKITSAAPKIPLLQDINSIQAWDKVFGAYYMDVIVYLDGRLFKYLPSALAISHSKDLLALSTSSNMEDLVTLERNPDQFKSILLQALNFQTKWCQVDQEGENNSTDFSATPSSNFYFVDDDVDQVNEYYDVVIGFIFAMIAIFGIIIGSLCVRCCCTYWNRVCCSSFIRLAMDEERLGEFQPLATEDEYDLKFQGYKGANKNSAKSCSVEHDPDRYEYGMDSDDDEDDGKYPTLPMKRLTNPTKAAEEFFRRQEAAEREITLQEALEQSRNNNNSMLDDDSNEEYLMSSLDLEMIERKIVESIGNTTSNTPI